MALSAKERRIINNVVARLSGDTATSDEVKRILLDDSFRCFLQTWVIAPLRIVADEGRTLYDLNTALGLSR